MDILEQVKQLRIEEAEERLKINFVKKLLSETDFDIEKIANLADVSIEFVEEIRADRD